MGLPVPEPLAPWKAALSGIRSSKPLTISPARVEAFLVDDAGCVNLIFVVLNACLLRPREAQNQNATQIRNDGSTFSFGPIISFVSNFSDISELSFSVPQTGILYLLRGRVVL